MTHIRTLTTLATLSLGCLAAAQEPTPAPRAEAEAQAPSTGKSVDELVRRLGDDSFKVRLQAERELRALGKDALPALRQAAEHEADAEVQWRARRLVRQIERGDTGGLDRRVAQEPEPRRPGLEPFDRTDVQDRFDQLFRSLERDFGMDIPRSRFFDADFFKDLDDQMQELRQRMQALQQGGVASGQSMSMQMGPDGVRVEIKRKNAQGEDETKVYEAPDVETFKQKYPGVLEQNGLGMRFWSGPLGGFRQLDPLPPGRGGQPWTPWPDRSETDLEPAPMVAPPPGKRLGVVVRPEIPAELRGYLGLEDGLGLMVDEVQPDMLAQRLGIERGDIVLQIGTQAIRGTADVQQALGDIAPGDKVEVKLLRRGKELVLQGAKPAEPATGTESTEPGGKPKGLERRK